MKQVTLEEFFDGDQMKIDVFKSKYLSHPDELVSECFQRISREIASVPLELDKQKAYALAEQWAEEMLSDEWRPGGSIIAGVNKKNRKISLMNCTTIPHSEDSLEGIFQCEYEVAKAAAHRQGIGIDFSVLRPRHTKIMNSAEISEGVVHWMKSMNGTAKKVGQLGRIPAMLFSVKIDHPDVEEVICCKDVNEEISYANISIQITDAFMNAVKENCSWELKFTVESSGEIISKMVNARDLFKKICDHAWISGDPGVQFIDLMNRFSIQKALGEKIVGTNACSEKPLTAYGVCALASINMEKVPHVSNLEALKQYLQKKVASMVRYMDNVVEYELTHKYKSPIDKQYETIKRLREIGLGITNLHKWLYDQGLEYDSDAGIAATEEFFRWYQYYAFKESINLSIERGPCPAWADLNNTIGRTGMKFIESEFLANLFAEFPDLEELYYTYGLRNAALLSLAPTGTISLTFACDVLSSGIEPAIAIYYWRRTRAISKGDWDYYFILPNVIRKEILSKISDTESEEYKIISEFSGSVLDNDGANGEEIIRIAKKYLDSRLLKNAYEIDPFKKVELIGKVQKYVDAAISVTYNVKSNFSKEDVFDLYMKAYDHGIKAIAMFREGSKDGIMFFEFPKGKKAEVKIRPEYRPSDVNYVFAPKRPKKLPCEIYKVLKHWVIVGVLNQRPYEMFIIENGHKMPETGFITKAGKRRYRLSDSEDHTIIENLIDDEVTNEEIQGITRLVSTSLRHGVPIDFIVDQLFKCGNSISAYPKMLGRVLKKYKFLMIETVKSDQNCPNCGNPMVKHDGCIQCLNCTFSKCGE